MLLDRLFSASYWPAVFTTVMLSVPTWAAAAQDTTASSAALVERYLSESADKQRQKSLRKQAYVERRKATEQKQQTIAERVRPVLLELDNLLAACERRGIPTDYERIVANLLPDAPQHGGYTPALDSAARAAVAHLRPCTTGAALIQPRAPRYITQKVNIRGNEFLGDARYPDGTVVHNRPLYLIGYGHSYQPHRDIERFAGYGINLISATIIGPYMAVFEAGTPDWQVERPAGDKRAWFRLDTLVAHTGRRSLVARNGLDAGTVGTFLRLAVKLGATYDVSAWIKGENVHGASLVIDPVVEGGHRVDGASTDTLLADGSYGWRQVQFQFVASSEYVDLRLVLDGPTDRLWLDDVSVLQRRVEPAGARPAGAAAPANLLPNGDFERVPTMVPGYDFYTSPTQLQAEFLDVLRRAEAHDIAVDVLISPHYFPAWVFEKWPTLSHGSGFLPYNVMDPRGRAVMEAYLKTLIPLIKDFKSLHSITLSNEPAFFPKRDSADAQQWRAYLQTLYGGDIQRLNHIYRTSYSTFAEVPMPNASSRSASYYDWVTFNSARFTEWHRWMATLIHSMAPKVPLNAKLMLDITAQESKSIDLEQHTDFFQINGNDNYTGDGIFSDPSNILLYLMLYDVQMSMKQAPTFNSEMHIGGPRSARIGLWQGAIHGRNSAAIWIWDPDIEDQIRRRPDVSIAVGRTTMDLNRLAPEVTAVRNTPTQAAILYSIPSKIYTPEHWDVLWRVYGTLSPRGRTLRFVTEHQLAAGQLGKDVLLVLPSITHVHASTLAAITRFAAGGGRILALGERVLTHDEHDQPLPIDDVKRALASAVRLIPPTTSDSADLASRERETFKRELVRQFETLVPNRVNVIDTVTQQTAEMVEWRSGAKDGKLLISVANYSNEAKTVYLAVDGRKLEHVTELIGGTAAGPTIRLDPWVPYLFELAEPGALPARN